MKNNPTTTTLELVRGMQIQNGRLPRSPRLDATHWRKPGAGGTLCGIVAGNRVDAQNPAQCVSCRKCSRIAAYR